MVEDGAVTFSLDDADDALEAVTLRHALTQPPGGPAFWREDGRWTLRWRLPDVARMEYQLELRHRDGGEDLICDPANPLRAGSPFGEKSVLELPGYRPPRWLEDEPAPAGDLRAETIALRRPRGEQRVAIWSPPGSDASAKLPLLVVHDGLEYAFFSSLTAFLERLTDSGELPPLRAALLPPIDRGEDYSASIAYSRRLAHQVLPALERVAPSPPERRFRAGMGASLGALAMLHAHRTQPQSFGALFLQSGSFFRPHSDRSEARTHRFRRICRFTGQTLRAPQWDDPIPIAMTCGSAEENVTCNRGMRAALQRQGYPLRYHESADGHNWVAWRDTLAPYLGDLLRRSFA
jgi:enterochelin esterase-like enzyme